MQSRAHTTRRFARSFACPAALALLSVTLAAPAGFAALAPPSAPAKAASAPARKRARRAVDTTALFHSRLLWSTIDVCNAPDQADTVGIRGSMPADGHAHDAMYMRFRLQYMNTTTKLWTDLTKSTASYVNVGAGASPRQAGRSFQLSPVAGQPAFTLRGVVGFQWRRGATVVAEVSRTTSAGRESLAGSDPAGFSTATCVIT